MSIIKDNLGNRMKDYEKRNQYYLQKRTPVAIRVDMRAGHSFTKGFKRPFDNIFIKTMQDTAKYMCENIQNAIFSYIQSDEITIVLIDYATLNTESWFNYRTDKLCSISASMATMAFNRAFAANVQGEILDYKTSLVPQCVEIQQEIGKYHSTLLAAVKKGALFDSRVFNIPKEEVTNLILWRQLDATRNSIQMVGQANFSHKELQNKTCNQIQDMLHEIKGINWNDYPTTQKRGSCCIKVTKQIHYDDSWDDSLPLDNVTRNYWTIDNNIPIFKNEGRAYIDKLVDI
jgi:tRNA(His) 5'-end guanylyltransferase